MGHSRSRTPLTPKVCLPGVPEGRSQRNVLDWSEAPSQARHHHTFAQYRSISRSRDNMKSKKLTPL